MNILDFIGKAGLEVVVEGRLSVKINGQKHLLSRGDFIIVTPLFVYEDFEESDDLRTETLRVDIPSFFEQMKRHLRISFPLFAFKHPVNQLSEDELQHCIHHFETIKRLKKQEEDADIPAALREFIRQTVSHNTESLLFSIISGLLWRNRDEIFAPTTPKEFGELLVPQFLLALSQNFHRERTVAFYASRANLSAAHFSTLIR